MKVTTITVARLFNLGSYEHVRYEISVEVKEGESATDALVGLEKIIEALKPESQCCVKTNDELERDRNRLDQLRELLNKEGREEFRRRHGHFVGTEEEYIERCEAMHSSEELKRVRYEKRAARARQLLDDLGGAAVWKDAKLDWESSEDFD
jgi:hypothetical protein